MDFEGLVGDRCSFSHLPSIESHINRDKRPPMYMYQYGTIAPSVVGNNYRDIHCNALCT